jgi:hypothetical protein
MVMTKNEKEKKSRARQRKGNQPKQTAAATIITIAPPGQKPARKTVTLNINPNQAFANLTNPLVRH